MDETTAQILQHLPRVEDTGQNVAIAVASGVVAIMAVRWFQMRYRAKARITYGDGSVVNSAPGRTLLEVSRANGIAAHVGLRRAGALLHLPDPDRGRQ